MDCIILAGGLGTRLRSVVPHLPKALAPIQGVPFLELVVQQLMHSGSVSKIILALGYLAEQVVQAFRKSPFPIEFSCEQHPLGTGGATLEAMKKTTSNPVLVVNGDTYLDISVANMLCFHREKGADATLAYRKSDRAERYGTLELSTEGQILGFREKMCSEGAINCGFYLFNRTLFDNLPFDNSFSLEQEAFPHFLNYKIFGFCHEGLFIDIGTPDAFAQSQELLRDCLR